jgi:hypothetical protein
MNRWIVDIVIGAVVLGVLLPILFILDNKRSTLLEQQARVEPSVLAACKDVASYAQGEYGTVKDRCLMNFDRQYAAARRADD